MAKKEEMKQENQNLRYYEQLRQVPDYALKQIGAGRLKGMSDINPLFRIKAMTEAFGPCGIGWKYVITKQWIETYGQEVKAFTNIDLFIKVNGEWSDAIPGTGGSAIVALERNGAYVSDEAYKMALTDALSVAMKALGVAADVYYSKDKQGQFDTKYEQQTYMAQQGAAMQSPQQPTKLAAAQQAVTVFDGTVASVITSAKTMEQLTQVWNYYPGLQSDKAFRDAWAAQRGLIEKK